jgi:hypothetical protein
MDLQRTGPEVATGDSYGVGVAPLCSSTFLPLGGHATPYSHGDQLHLHKKPIIIYSREKLITSGKISSIREIPLFIWP